MSPSADQRWIDSACMPVYVGGAELNVATALALWGIPVRYFTAVPDNYLSTGILESISGKDIDTRDVLRMGARVGLYYLEQGTDLQHAAVIYDRSGSSFSSLCPGDVDWDKLLTDVSFFHFSAIAPALNENISALCLEGVREAVRRKITVSTDLNFRASLWKSGRDPVKVMEPLVGYCRLIMGNIWSANSLLGIPVDKEIKHFSDDDYRLHAHITAKAIRDKFPACEAVASTFRFDGGKSGVRYFATFDRQDKQYSSPSFSSASIKDRVGSGDCFMAGLIYGSYTKLDPQKTIEFAATAAFLKMHEVGDSTGNTIHTIQSAAKHDKH